MREDLGPAADVPEGRGKCVTIAGKTYGLFRFEGGIYCTDGRCTHVGGPVCAGSLHDAIVTCPWHGSRFDVRTGQVVGGPARNPLASHPTVVENGHVFLDLP
jgi:3-phenylpropionate/trans-cinnamate dioxygenase ferredoxin component